MIPFRRASLARAPGAVPALGAFLTLGLSIALGACTSAGGPNPAKDMVQAAGLTGGDPKAAPDFVAQTRPGSLDYIPATTTEPSRNPRRKSANEVSQAEAEMEALRNRNAARGAAARRAAGN